MSLSNQEILALIKEDYSLYIKEEEYKAPPDELKDRFTKIYKGYALSEELAKEKALDYINEQLEKIRAKITAQKTKLSNLGDRKKQRLLTSYNNFILPN